MKLTIKKIARNQKISSKTNKPYTSMGILTVEYGDQWINGFGNKDNESWKEGDVIDVQLKEGEYSGNKTINIITPNKDDKVMDALRKIFSELQEIKKLINK